MPNFHLHDKFRCNRLADDRCVYKDESKSRLHCTNNDFIYFGRGQSRRIDSIHSELHHSFQVDLVPSFVRELDQTVLTFLLSSKRR